VKTKVVNDTYFMTFDSLKEFLSISTDPRFPDGAHEDNERDFNDLHNDQQNSWRYGSESTKEKYLATRSNPKKGKELCLQSIKKTMADKSYKDLISQALTYKKKIKYADTGSRISVARAIAGEDNYFVTRNSAQRPTVKLAINMCVSAGCDDEMLMMIAKSAIPTVYALETAGICTEIWLCTFSSHAFQNSDGFHYDVTQVRIKSAQERFNWTTFAPVFTTGSYRHGFFLSWLRQGYQLNDGYGSPMRSDVMEEHDNYGYAAIIGGNAPGPVELVKEVFSKIKS
jgi:hypothetical protein